MQIPCFVLLLSLWHFNFNRKLRSPCCLSLEILMAYKTQWLINMAQTSLYQRLVKTLLIRWNLACFFLSSWIYLLSDTLWLVSLPDKWTHINIVGQEYIVGGHLENAQKSCMWTFLITIVITCQLSHLAVLYCIYDAERVLNTTYEIPEVSPNKSPCVHTVHFSWMLQIRYLSLIKTTLVSQYLLTALNISPSLMTLLALL